MLNCESTHLGQNVMTGETSYVYFLGHYRLLTLY